MRIGAALALCGAGLAWAQQTGYADFRGKDGDFVIQNWASLTGTMLGPGKVSAKGKPVQILVKNQGFSVAADSIDAESAVDESAGEYYLKSAVVAGSATAALDSEAAYAYEIQHAQAAGRPVPLKAEDVKRFSVAGPTFSYAGDYKIGTIDVPKDFSGTWFSHGVANVKTKQGTARQEIDASAEVHGVSGTLEFFVQAETPIPIRKGTVMGPLTLTYKEISKLDGKPQPPRLFSARVDRLDLDFLSPVHTITLTGNVVIEGEGEGYTGSAKAAKAVLTLDENGALQQIHMEGTPTVTNLKPLKSGGGGR